jgi:ATP-binding cassette subfamily B (MDR/TAP) protein 1
MMMLVMNFAMLAEVFPRSMGIVGASDKIVALINYEPIVNSTGGDKLTDTRGVIELENVKFHYPSKTDVEVLKGVNITVDGNKKKVVALCGMSGCGKSSIVAMMERFYDPNEGSVKFNGVDIKTLEPNWYHG